MISQQRTRAAPNVAQQIEMSRPNSPQNSTYPPDITPDEDHPPHPNYDEPEKGWNYHRNNLNSSSSSSSLFTHPELDDNTVIDPWPTAPPMSELTRPLHTEWSQIWEQRNNGRLISFETKYSNGNLWYSILVQNFNKVVRRLFLKPNEIHSLKIIAPELLGVIYNTLASRLQKVHYIYPKSDLEDAQNYNWYHDICEDAFRKLRLSLRVCDPEKPEDTAYIYLTVLTKKTCAVWISNVCLKLSEFVDLIYKI